MDVPAKGRYEPRHGCYIGAIIERDNRVGRDYATFNQRCGKAHAMFFDYRSFGNPLPDDRVGRAWAVGAGYQIALEPHGGMRALLQGPHLETFALQCREADSPLFIRLASEMNGDWVPWHGNPQEFIAIWRQVYTRLHAIAPNAVLVWSPNSIPTEPIEAYYPGDEYVDWVGVNFYVVHHHNNNLDDPAMDEDPLSHLEYVYRKYAHRKPIMISETAVTHYCAACEQDVTDWAVSRIRRIYREIPTRFPELDSISWYDIDNLSHQVRAGRNTNDFSLTDNAAVLQAYREAIRSDYYRSTIDR